jgi:hypothetical protein
LVALTDGLYVATRGGSGRLQLDTSGNLGLGVTPSAWISSWKSLDVTSGGSSLFGSLAIGGIATNCFFDSGATWRYKTSYGASKFQQGSTGDMAWFTAPSGTAGNAISFTQAMTLDASGNLLVGTTGIAGMLTVGLTSTTNAVTRLSNFPTNARVVLSSGSSSTTDSKIFLGAGFSSNGNGLNSGFGFIRESTNNWGTALAFYTHPTPTNTEDELLERARIDSSGNLLVGTTSSSGRLTVRLDSTTASPQYIVNAAATGTFIKFEGNGSVLGSITFNGSNTAYNTSSDYRLKNITGPITNSGAYIDSLNPVEGTWKADGSVFVGLIAHEAQEASRTPVATGVKDGAEMQAMDYSNAELIANLIAELQSVRKRLAAAGI